MLPRFKERWVVIRCGSYGVVVLWEEENEWVREMNEGYNIS